MYHLFLRSDTEVHNTSENFDPNEDSLLAELHLATSGSNVPGLDQIIIDNEKLTQDKYVWKKLKKLYLENPLPLTLVVVPVLFCTLYSCAEENVSEERTNVCYPLPL